MNSWCRMVAFFIFLAVCSTGLCTLSRLFDCSVLMVMVSNRTCEQSSLCQEAGIGFKKTFGYWKDIYKAYQLMAYLEYKKGNLHNAKAYLRTSLHYHPYYPNGYRMLGFFLGRDTTRGKACFKIYRIIMEEGSKPDKELMNLCTSVSG